MEYLEALAYINDKDKYGSKLGLDSIGRLMDKLSNPQDKLKVIHIAGTNGKGSTSSYLANILREGGYNVGLFTSPFLERFNERIQVNGLDIGDDSLARLTLKVKEAIDKLLEEGREHPTTFEIVTAIAFLYYEEKKVDYVVLEVGLGGRYDSTNIIKSSLASVITTIDYDHINELGDTLEKIAYQKAGIIKKNSIVVSYPQEDSAEGVIKNISGEKNCQYSSFSKEDISIIEESYRGSSFNFKYRGLSYEDIEISMIGTYQIYNSALAIATIQELNRANLLSISKDALYRGLKKTKWNGRLELLRDKPKFLIDGAHNIQGIENLARALELFNYNKLILGVSILKDKDVDNMLSKLIPMADEIIITEVDIPRKLDAEKLDEKIKKYKKKTYIERDRKKAVDLAFEIAGEHDLILFGGSLYLIGEIRGIVNSR